MLWREQAWPGTACCCFVRVQMLMQVLQQGAGSHAEVSQPASPPNGTPDLAGDHAQLQDLYPIPSLLWLLFPLVQT